jgi:hypothetical protein
VFDFLKKLVSGNRQDSASRRDHPSGVTHRNHVLVTKRVESPIGDEQSFRQTYACTTCKALFKLAWQPELSIPMEGCHAVPGAGLPGGIRDLDKLPVFCPVCGTSYPEYGMVDWPYDLRQGPERIELIELGRQTVVRPGCEGIQREDLPFLKGFSVEHVVVFFSGELLPEIRKKDIVSSALAATLGDDLNTDLANGPIEVHVAHVDPVTDETAMVSRFVQEHVCREQALKPRILLTSGIVALPPPLKEAMLCLVLPPRG